MGCMRQADRQDLNQLLLPEDQNTCSGRKFKKRLDNQPSLDIRVAANEILDEFFEATSNVVDSDSRFCASVHEQFLGSHKEEYDVYSPWFLRHQSARFEICGPTKFLLGI